MAHSIDLMLFDLDGTLINSIADLTGSINLMLKDLGRPPLGEQTVRSFVGDGVRVLVYRSLTATSASHEPPGEELHAEGIRLMETHYQDHMLLSTTLYPGIAETLGAFAGKRKALVTSKASHFALQLLKHFGIAEHFDGIVGGDMVAARKPDPEPVTLALKILGGSAEKAVMIGDSENDVWAGQRAGTLTCGVTYGFRTADELRITNPDVLIDRFDQLQEYFC